MPTTGRPHIDLLILLAKLAGDLAFFSVLFRYAMEPYRIYGFPPLMERFLHIVDQVCMPVERVVFNLRLPMASLTILILGVAIALIRGLFYASFSFGTRGLPMGGVPTSLWEFFEFFFSLLLLMGLLSVVMRRTNVWQYRNIPLQLIDRVAGSVFGLVARLIGRRRPWLMLVAAAVLLSVLYGGLSCVLTLRYDWRVLAAGAARIPVAVVNAYAWVLICRVLLSWFQTGISMEGHVPQVLHACTDPYLDPFQRLLPFLRYKGIDLTPIVSIGLLFFLGGHLGRWVEMQFLSLLPLIPVAG